MAEPARRFVALERSGGGWPLSVAVGEPMTGASGCVRAWIGPTGSRGMMKARLGLAVAVLASLALAGCSAAGSPAAGGASAAASSGPTAGALASAAAVSTPTPKPDWYVSTYGTFAPTTVSGTTDQVIPVPAGAKAGIITASFTGTANFIIGGLDSGNQPTADGTVNTIGNYTGSVPFGLVGLGNPTTSFQVTGKGKWTITIAPMSSAAPLPASGTGSGVFKYDGPAKSWTLSHTGQANFIVQQYTADPMPGLGVNEIGSYSGTVPGLAGPSIVEIQADGTWTAS